MNKSKKSIPKYYWDANVFLHLIDETSGKIDVLHAILEKANRGEVVIYCSVLNITEVAYGHEERIKKKLSDETLKKIDKLWHPKSPIKLVEITQTTLLKSRELIRKFAGDGKTGLRSADSIHLATAIILDVDEFHCYEKQDRLKKYGNEIGLLVKQPDLEQMLLTNDYENNSE